MLLVYHRVLRKLYVEIFARVTFKIRIIIDNFFANGELFENKILSEDGLYHIVAGKENRCKYSLFITQSNGTNKQQLKSLIMHIHALSSWPVPS